MLKVAADLLRLVAAECAYDGVLLSLHTVEGTVDVALCLCGGDLCFAVGMLLFSSVRPASVAGGVAKGLLRGAHYRVPLAGGLVWLGGGGVVVIVVIV